MDRGRAPPVPATPLVGRERELDAVGAALLADGGRLLTLVGPPGVGKTRLAQAAAAALRGRFPEGVWFVPLAPLAGADLVAPAVAAALGVPPAAATPGGAADALAAALRFRRALLVLDNFEHLLAAAPLVARLLAGCPDLRVLATSRRPLRLAGEREYPVPPLAVPAAPTGGDLGAGSDGAGALPPAALEALRRSPAVALFVQRAQDVWPDFVLDGRNAATVAEVCRRLDGLPLAIELAAARTKLLPPGALLARLAPALPLLAGGPRDAPARQQTLRRTLAWSDALLSAGERADLRRLGVFVGGCTVGAAGAVLCGWPDAAAPATTAAAPAAPDRALEALERLGALLDHSLLRHEAADADDEPRFGMLETIREYALEQLAAADETAPAQRRHAAAFLELAERARGATHGPEQGAWFDQLERDHGNLRAALRWAIDRGEAETGVRLAQALRWFWEVRGHVAEGHRLVGAVLALPALAGGPAGPGTPWRPRALAVAGHLWWLARDYAAAVAAAGEGAALARTRGDRRCLADALLWQGSSTLRVDVPVHGGAVGRFASDRPRRGAAAAAPAAAAGAARRLLEESLACWRELGEAWGEAQALEFLGAVLRDTGDPAGARPRYEAALALRRGLGDARGQAQTLQSLANLAAREGDYGRAAALSAESLALARELGDWNRVAVSLSSLAVVARDTGDPGLARRHLEALLAAAAQADDVGMVATASFRLAELTRAAGDAAGAATLYARCLRLCRRLAHRDGVTMCLVGLAAVALERGRPAAAARLLGAAAAARAAAPAFLSDIPWVLAGYERTAGAVRGALAAHPAAPAWLEGGRALTPERAAEEALREAADSGAGDPDPERLRPGAASAGSAVGPRGSEGLTPREREVAVLVARGATNRQIAARLVVAERTAMRHVEHILNKLGVHSRAQIAVWAAEHGLLTGP